MNINPNYGMFMSDNRHYDQLVSNSLDSEVFLILLKKWGLLDSKHSNNIRFNIFNRAIIRYHHNLLTALCEAGVDPNCTSLAEYATPILVAITHHRLTAMTILLKHGAKVGVCEKQHSNAHMSPLYKMIEPTHIQCLQVYLSLGGSPNAIVTERSTLLHLALYKNVEAVEVLLAYGADPNYESALGNCFLAAAMRRSPQRTVKLLLAFGAKNTGIYNPLFIAHNQKSQKLLELAPYFGESVLKEYYHSGCFNTRTCSRYEYIHDLYSNIPWSLQSKAAIASELIMLKEEVIQKWRNL